MLVEYTNKHNREESTYPVTFKCLDTPAALGWRVVDAARRREFPHLDRLVQTATDQVTAVGRECHTVDTVLVSVWALQSLDQVALRNIPDTNALVKRTSGDVLGIGRDGNSGDAIFYGERQHGIASLDIPQPDGSVTTARSNCAAVASKVQTVDILLVTRESVADSSAVDVPDADELVLGTGGEVLAIRTETDAPDVQVARNVDILVGEHANLFTSLDVVDLSGPVATSGNVLAVVAETHTANDALVGEGVHQLNV